MGGTPIRTLAASHELSLGTVSKRITEELEALPKNEELTKTYATRFGGVLLVDGVYLKIKGYPKAVPFIYGIDFETHDVPAGMLAVAESEGAFLRLFEMAKDAHYPLRLVVADEAPALKPALARVFPEAAIQLCQVHVVRNIRTALHLTNHDRTHLLFFLGIQKLFAVRGEESRQKVLADLTRAYDRHVLYWEILRSLMERWDDLFRFESIWKEGYRSPRTNNLIEAYNSHFKARVDSIKGFESFSSASRFVNGWMLRRRFTPFQGCGKHFKHLNGHCSFEKSRNPDLPWPEILGLSPPKIPTQE